MSPVLAQAPSSVDVANREWATVDRIDSETEAAVRQIATAKLRQHVELKWDLRSPSSDVRQQPRPDEPEIGEPAEDGSVAGQRTLDCPDEFGQA